MRKKNVLVIGGGAREQVLVEFLAASPNVNRVWCYPGNAGTDQICEPIKSTIKLDDPEGLLTIASSFNADLTVVGPELPAIVGTADWFQKAQHAILCPSARAARLEGSKIFAKQFMKRHGIPTAPFDVYYSPEDIRRAALTRNWKSVIKADGLCGGKGVYVCQNIEDVENAIDQLFTKSVHGAAGSSGVVEDLLTGVETSFFASSDGLNFAEFGTGGDHKRVYDGDKGPNTGGMGAFWPCPYVDHDEATKRKILWDIVGPTIGGMFREKNPFRGFLYVGLMLTADGPKVLEYNVRFGDPEAQVVIPSIDTSQIDSYELLLASATGHLLRHLQIPWHSGARVGVVMTSGNYPGKELPGFKAQIEGPIRIGEAGPDVNVYHAATVREGEIFWATPGRVMTVSARGESYEQAIERAYKTVSSIHFSRKRYRSDIGARAVAASKKDTKV
ncbi:MAG: phosphoribosylamine--glycine ligase [Candidatus Doudnabacteria bacterium]|nr:phosphoribosylamine--glycine ligase [Candidatus Doudnabacteria bacterium]